MRFIKMVTENFQGLSGVQSWDLTHRVIIRIGNNGSGKTSFANAFRYCLTGMEPEEEMIYRGAQKAAVILYGGDGTVYRRERNKKGNQCYINQKGVTASDFNSRINGGGDLKNIRIAFSSELVRTLRPQDLENFLLCYSPQPTRAEVEGYLEGMTDGMKRIIEAGLPDGPLSNEALNQFYKTCYAKRASLKKSLIAKKAERDMLVKGLTAPKRTKDVLQAEYMTAKKEYEDAAASEERCRAYRSAEETQKKQMTAISTLDEEIAGIIVKAEPENYKERLLKEKDDIEKKRELYVKQFTSFKASLESMEKVLTNLNRPICPISDKLVCTTDKSGIKKELDDACANARKTMETIREEVKTLDSRKRQILDQIEKSDQNKNALEKKNMLIRQRANLKKAVINLPEKPEAKDVKLFDTKKEQAAAELRNYENYEKYLVIRKNFKEEKAAYIDYDNLIQAFGGKGVVKEKITRNFVHHFEDACNAKLEHSGSPMRVRFQISEGVNLLTDPTGKGEFFRFGSLSGGERAMVMYIILSLLSDISGAHILFLDELFVMDRDMLETLFKIISAEQDRFDYIVISMIDHPFTRELLSKFSFL